jgi:dTMP kinase
MARDLVRGADRAWTRNLYSPALVPDAVFYFRVGAAQLVERNFQKNSTLDYWESGMDLGLSRDMFSSFMKFQRMLQNEFQKMQKEFGFEVLNGNLRVETIQRELRKKIGGLLGIGKAQQQEPPLAAPIPPVAPAAAAASDPPVN